MKKLFFLITFLVSIVTMGQSSFSGIIKDSKTKEPLPFATIVTNNGLGEITDSYGRFTIKTKTTVQEITISYIGYKSKTVSTTKNETYLQILLEPSQESLNEVVITSKENPALRIIKNAINSRKRNNILTALNSFKYSAYNKLLITADPDSISGKVDSVFVKRNNKRIFKKLDSSNYKFKKQIDKQHLYITEKIAEHTFKRGKNKKETVLASRMAGFKSPVYELLALNLENFTFYNEKYRLVGNNYVNPLSKSALKNYSYKILDTLKSSNHNTYMIYYKHKEQEDAVGLEGVLYINSKSYALEKGIAELRGKINVKATQNFKFKPQHNIWFPDETSISIRKGKSNKNVNIFGGVIRFVNNSPTDSIMRTNQKDVSDVTYLLSKTKISNITINEPVRVINSASTIEINDDANSKNQSYWNKYRSESITNRGLEAYRIIDSLTEAQGVEKKLNIARKVFKGYFPAKYFDIDLSQIANFNNYEGFRIGFGGTTNNLISDKYKFSAYTGYGFKDKAVKFGVNASARLSKINNTWVKVGYADDLSEAAKMDFLLENTSFSLTNTRNLNISQFYNFKEFNVGLTHDLFPNLETILVFKHGKYIPRFEYQYKNINDFKLTTATAGFKWTPFSKYMNSPIGKIPVKNGWPKINTQITKSFDGVLANDFDFTKVNFKIEYRVKTLKNTSTTFLAQGGIVFGNAPLTHLYNATANYRLRNPWITRVNFIGANSFETMTYNEFISDRYIMFQARHNFRSFKITKKIQPNISFISRFAIGSIDNSQNHQGVAFKKMNKGYLESGFQLNDIYGGLGLGTFYRHGGYKNDKFSDNLALKLTYVLSLGF